MILLNLSWEAETSSTWKLIFVLCTKLLICLFCNILYTLKGRLGEHSIFPREIPAPRGENFINHFLNHFIYAYIKEVQQIHLLPQLNEQQILSHIITFNMTPKTQSYTNLTYHDYNEPIQQVDPHRSRGYRRAQICVPHVDVFRNRTHG
jgi:hypothetical protein